MRISSPVTWHGGKSKLSAKIVGYFPEHQTYVEPFGGSAAVLLAKKPSKVEVYNDLDGGLVNLFQVLRNATLYRRLRRALDRTRYARAEFFLSKEPSDDPVESARRFIVRQRQSRGGLGERWSYCVGDSRGGMSSAVARWQTGLDQLPSVHERFRHVQIECEDWRTILTRYQGRKTLFYIDPPYLPETRTGGKYQYELSERDHRELVARILASRSMFVLSGYANETYKPLEKAGWMRVDFEVRAFSSDRRTRRTECLWLSPSITTCSGNGQKVLTPVEKMKAGAHHTHDVRVGQTTKKTVRAIERLLKCGKKPTKAAVARMVEVSRGHLSRRYKHLFET
jgi:DNA adenine methylase